MRLLLFGLAGMVVLLAGVVALAFTSVVQTWAAHRALAGQSMIEVGRVAAGLHSVKLEKIRIVQPGQVLTLPALRLDLPLLSALHKKVLIQKLIVQGWTLDLTAPGEQTKSMSPPKMPAGTAPSATTPAARTAVVFQGIFQQLQLPVDLAVESVELSGEIIFPANNPKQPPGHAHVVLTGGRLAAGQEAKFDFQIDAALGDSTAAVQSLTVRGTFIALLDGQRTFSHLDLVSDGTATGTQFPHGTSVHVALDALRAAGGEHYTAQLTAAGKPLFTFNADYVAATPKLTGTWQCDVRDADLVPFALGRPLPVFEATSDGKLETDAAFAEVHGTGHMHVAVEKLESVRPELSALGKLTLDAIFDVTQHFDAAQNSRVVRVDRFDATLVGAQPVAEVHALQPFEFNPAKKELKVADLSKNLLSCDLTGLPLAWAQPMAAGFSLSGSDITAALQASARDGSLHLETSAPVEIKNFAVARAGQPLVRLDRASLNFGVDYTPQGWQADLLAAAQTGSKTFCTLQIKAGGMADPTQPIKATGVLQADLPAILAQPALASATQLTGGAARIEFQTSFDTKKEIELKAAFSGLAAPQASSLPTITADVRGELLPDGKITFSVPVVFENAGRKSDLALSGTFQSSPGAMNIDGRIASTFIVADDMKSFTAVLAAPPSPSPAASTPAPAAEPDSPSPAETRDTAPFWKGVSGQVALAMKKIVYGQFEVNEVTGELKLGSDAVVLDQLRAVLGTGGEAKLAGALNFATSAPEPYALKATVEVSGVESAPLFRALDPSKPPTVEGKFNFAGQFTSAGLNPADLGQRAQGTMSLTSKGGLFRGLAKNSGTKVVSGGLNLLGNLKNSKETVALGQITSALQEFPYDQINLQLVRGQSLDVQLKEFSVISQQLRLAGTGALAYQKGKPLLDQKLTLQVQMGVRGDFEAPFSLLRKLSSEKDELGYTKVSRAIKIGGTPTHPDTTDLYVFLLEGVAARAAEHFLNIKDANQLLNGLFGGKKQN